MRDRVEQWIERYGPVVVVFALLIEGGGLVVAAWTSSYPHEHRPVLFTSLSFVWVAARAAAMTCAWHLSLEMRETSWILGGGLSVVAVFDILLCGFFLLGFIVIGVFGGV